MIGTSVRLRQGFGGQAAVAAMLLVASAGLAAQSAIRANRYNTVSRIVRPTVITCQNGQYSEEGKGRVATEDAQCQRQRMNATAVAISVAPSSYATIDNPPCTLGNTDATALALARTQIGGTVTNAALYSALQRRAELLGSDASLLAQGSAGAQANTSTCQLFVLRVPVRASAIRLVEFQANQNQKSDNQRCFDARVGPSKTGDYALYPASGSCAIAWSGWQSGLVVDDPGTNSALVTGVFKNWSSDRTRSGQIWVWYGGSPASAVTTVPRAPSGVTVRPR